MMKITNLFLLAILSLTLLNISCTESDNDEDKVSQTTINVENNDMNQPKYEAPKGLLDTDKTYLATIITNQPKGEILIELFGKIAPIYVENFVNLAESGFYDNSSFHRVIPGFMAQAGTKNGDGFTGPGYKFNDFFHPDMKHDSAGILSMANAGLNTNSSQFFITYGPTSYLDPYDENGNAKECGAPVVSCHAVFGKVIEGMDIVEKITPINPGDQIDPTKILSIKIDIAVK